MNKIMMPIVFFCSIIAVSCSKSPEYVTSPGCVNTPVSSDSSALLNFATANNIATTKDASGLYYQIITPGTGATATSTSAIEVSYKGTLLNGVVFDSTATNKTATFNLNQLIQGWQIGIPKIKAGGRIKLLVPSALAYGCAGAGSTISSNTPIFFDMILINVK